MVAEPIECHLFSKVSRNGQSGLQSQIFLYQWQHLINEPTETIEIRAFKCMDGTDEQDARPSLKSARCRRNLTHVANYRHTRRNQPPQFGGFRFVDGDDLLTECSRFRIRGGLLRPGRTVAWRPSVSHGSRRGRHRSPRCPARSAAGDPCRRPLAPKSAAHDPGCVSGRSRSRRNTRPVPRGSLQDPSNERSCITSTVSGISAYTAAGSNGMADIGNTVTWNPIEAITRIRSLDLTKPEPSIRSGTWSSMNRMRFRSSSIERANTSARRSAM